MQSTNFKSDRGSAILEFVTFGLLLNLGILAFALQLLQFHQSQLAAESIARHAARAISQGSTESAVVNLAASIAKDFAIDPSEVKTEVTCKPAACEIAESVITVRVEANGAKAEAVILVAQSTDELD